MISSLWSPGVDRVYRLVPGLTTSDLSVAMIISQDAAFVCAFLWILYRCWQIYKKPREDLEELLGLDIPPIPEVSLAGITCDSVLLYWKPPDLQSVSLRLAIQVNGIRVGEFSKGDTSIQITGLKPGNHYNIRVLATNTANFTTLGPLIRLRTLPSPSPLEGDTAGQGEANEPNEAAAVHATSTNFDMAPTSNLNKENSSIQHQTRRVISGRRNSPASSSGEPVTVHSTQANHFDEDESPEAIQRLTERLSLLRAENEKLEKEIAEDEEDSRRNLADLSRERDQLRQEYREKEEASSELRKHGNHLDKLNRSAQSRKAAKEKQLQQKKADRYKLRDDIAKWESETKQMKQDTEDMIRATDHVVATKDKEVSEIRGIIAEDFAMIKSLEEEIRSTGAQIKAMEKEQERLNSGGDAEHDWTKIERESDQAWELRMQAMQTQLGTLWQTLQHTQVEQQHAEEHLAWWMSKRARNPEQFAPIPTLDFTASVSRTRSRKSRQTNSRASTISSPPAPYSSVPASYHNGAILPPSYSAGSPLFNMSNGMTVSSVVERSNLPQTDAEMMSTTGPMSPAASDLLPSNLFRDEDATTQHYLETNGQASSGVNESTEVFSGHALTNSDVSAHGPNTPASASSRAGSIFSSTHESSQNLPGHQSRPDPFVENDQHSLSSTSAPFHSSVPAGSNPLASSRLANLFSSTFNRQRGKPGSQEPPPLGTLKQGQSQSFPRNLDQDDLDLHGGRRRRGSHGTWANPMAGLLSRNNPPSGDSGLITARTGSGGKSRLNMFAPRIDGVESLHQRSTSRPSSTYSFDQVVARPSVDSQPFGWPIPESLPNRSSPLGGHWSGGPWSHAPSRRPSVKHDSTSNLSVGSTPLEIDGYPGSFPKHSSDQAPIGTRPQSSHRPSTPRLNPAAPSFKMFRTRGDSKKSVKAEKTGSKTTEKGKDKRGEKEDVEDIDFSHESPPQNPRLSRDAQSITTATSTADSHDSFDRSTSGTPSEAVTPSGPKETLMQKITRKSSSSKFNVPWSKERGLFSKRVGEPTTPGEMDEDTSSENQLGKSVESTSSTPQQEKAGRSSISWTNIKRKSRKGDQALNEAADRRSDLGDDDG